MAARELTAEEGDKLREVFTSWLCDKQDSFLQEIFGILDRDGNGSLDEAEVFATIKALTGSSTAEEAKAELEDADTNKDGKISLEEYIEKMKAEF